MTEALTRILGLKAHLGLHRKSREEALAARGRRARRACWAKRFVHVRCANSISRDSVTLVKHKDKDVLPVTPERYKRIMIVHVKGAESGMAMLIRAMGMGGGSDPAVDAEGAPVRQGL